jgi:hypothetical protein
MTAIKTKELYSWVVILLSLLLILLSVYLTSWGNKWSDHDAQRYQHDIEQTFPLFSN